MSRDAVAGSRVAAVGFRYGWRLAMHTSFVIIGKGRPPLWSREEWLSLVPALDPLVKAAGKDAGVRSTQGMGERFKQVAFGRLGWDAKSHVKWTHEADDAKKFLNVQLWVPRWTKTDVNGPELFLEIDEPFVISKVGEGQFNQVLHLAVSDELRARAEEPLARALTAVHKAADGVLAVARRAPWLSRGDCVQDLVNNHLRLVGNDSVPDATKFRGRFIPFEPGATLPQITDDDADSRFDMLGGVSGASSGAAGAPATVSGDDDEDGDDDPGIHAPHAATPGTRSEEPVVYDKAKYHSDGDYPEDLSPDQAFVHAGMFLGWLIDRDLVSDEFKEETRKQIAEFKHRKLTGPEVYERWDGCLVDDMLSDEGSAFAKDYFLFEREPFLADYGELFLVGLPSLYHVSDTWENYEKLKVRIDERFKEWRGGKRWA